jgi:hypothetical protein
MGLPVHGFRPGQHRFLFSVEVTAQFNISAGHSPDAPHIKQSALNAHFTGLHLLYRGPLAGRKVENGIRLTGNSVLHHHVMLLQQQTKNTGRSLSQYKQAGKQDQGYYFSAGGHVGAG